MTGGATVAGDAWVVLGGAGFIGTALRAELRERGQAVTVVDRLPPTLLAGETFLECDVHGEIPELPDGHVVVAFGQSMPRPVRPWTLVLDNAVASARLADALAGREVTLLSTIEVYGAAPGPLVEGTTPVLPVELVELDAWVDIAMVHAREPVSPHRSHGVSSLLADRDLSRRWVYALSKLAQEVVLARIVGPQRLCVLRLANVVGSNQHRVVGRFVEAVLEGRPCRVTSSVRSFVSVDDVARVIADRPGPGVWNVASDSCTITELARLVGATLAADVDVVELPAPAVDSCGDIEASRLVARTGPLESLGDFVPRCVHRLLESPAPMFDPPLGVVVPPRPHRPDLVADRIATTAWSGQVRDGRWTEELKARLSERLGLAESHRLELVSSGTNALRCAVWAVAGAPSPDDVALCPAFTFHATAEVLRQLGWTVRLVDVDPWTWTIDPDEVATHLQDSSVRLVVAVDSLGNPADYDSLAAICRAARVPLVADSAPSLGASYDGRPVGTQADAHAFSMSFAKTLTGGGSGGAVVVSRDMDLDDGPNWLRSSWMLEATAIAALDQLEVLERLVQRREQVAAVYADGLQGRTGFNGQYVRPGDRHALVHWAVRVPRTVGRDRLARLLVAQGVGSKAYYEPMRAGSAAAMPVTAALHRESLALPMSSELSVDEAERVMTAVARSLRALHRATGSAESDTRESQAG